MRTSIESKSSLSEKAVYEEALRLVELTPQMEGWKNLYENKIMRLYTQPEVDPVHLETLIKEYVSIRAQGCMLNRDFADGTKSANGHIYQGALQEQVLKELGMADPVDLQSIDWYNILSPKSEYQFAPKFDVEDKYNMQGLNNSEAIGYQHLQERAANPENNRDIAHDTAFDKMMADYFLGKRRDVQEGNRLVPQFEAIFRKEDKTPFNYQ